MKAALSICLLLILCFPLLAQQDSTVQVSSEVNATAVKIDSADLPKPHSPTRASLYSMAIPGLGQAYNKKYWKIPLVYAGIGIPVYFGILEQKDFNDARNEYRNRVNNSDTSESYELYSDEALLQLIDTKRYNRDLLFIIGTLVYVLNIVDASVDAHFFDFDVTDDLSLHWQP